MLSFISIGHGSMLLDSPVVIRKSTSFLWYKIDLLLMEEVGHQ